ncbi:RagB/SusD family nutrient uptake outer membrane protein [Mucilaginibacter gynuensis]|uniref:RagB/SusD family nutrient uptake outer membrane protein n=1 Tax=Mucilaginibacter gynuensis TaxID=1302236 RepID=A0ABP8FLW7_9SPHI
MKSNYKNILNIKMKKILYITLMSLVVFTGCNKVLDKESVRVVGEVNMWNTVEDARAGIMGVYALTRAALSDNNGHWIYGDVRTGEFMSPNRQDLKAVRTNTLNASYPVVEALSDWTRYYAIVNGANIFLERIAEVRAKDKRYTENNMTVDIAQARFLRAFAYFYMVRIWGDVPFITASHDGQFEDKPREDKNKILTWAEQEMLKAAADLPFAYSRGDIQQQGDYYNEGSGRWGGALATKNTAYAVLAHLAAWQSDYSNVATYAKFVEDNYGRSDIGYTGTADLTNSNGFFFNKNPRQMFGFNSDWGHIDGSVTGHIEELTLAEPLTTKKVPDIFMPKDTILKIFDVPNDERFSIDTLGQARSERYFTNFNGKYPIFSKIKAIQGGTNDPNFRYFTSALVFTRLEDIVLLRAEALAVLGDRNGALNELVNVMARRGITTINIGDKEMIDMVFEERHRELLGEGQRWYDLIRYNKIKQNNPGFLNLINSGGIYWPVSRKLLSQNKLLTQNPYWK